MDILWILFFDEIVMGLGYLLMGILAISAINFIISNIAKIIFVILAIVFSVKIIKKTGKKGALSILGILLITRVNFAIADYLYNTSPNYRFSKDATRQVTLARCNSEFQIRDVTVYPGNVLILEELTGNDKWSTSVRVLNKGTSSFYAQEPLTLITSNGAVTELTTTTKPVANKLEEDCETVVNSTNDELLELVKKTEYDLSSMHSSSRSDQMAHYTEQIIGSTFSDVKDGRAFSTGDIKERTILTFDKKTVHKIIGNYKCVTNANHFGFHWEEVSVLVETDVPYTFETALFGGLNIRVGSEVYRVRIDDTYTVTGIDIYDD